MEYGLANKKVIVTGSSKGIGKAIAEAFLREGATVLVTGRDKESLDQTVAAFTNEYGADNILSFCGDLTDTTQISACIDLAKKEWGSIDILVPNVGSGKSMPGLQADMEEWKRMFDLNLFGAVEMVRQTVPLMPSGSSITFIASIAGVETLGAPVVYESAKAGIIALAEGLCKELADKEIRVNAVSPGNIYFAGGRWEEILSEKPELKDKVTGLVPMKRFGAPGEIANTVTFLSSDKAAFITGINLIVDGGQTRHTS